jgi:hypothetical protein
LRFRLAQGIKQDPVLEITNKYRPEDMAQKAECLPSQNQTHSSIPSTTKKKERKKNGRQWKEVPKGQNSCQGP